MKIALFVHCFLPKHFYGTEIYTFNLAKNLQYMGHDVVVVTTNYPWEPKQEETVLFYEYEGLPVYCIDKNSFPYTSIKSLYYQPEIKNILRQLLCEIKPDLVHVTHIINHTAVLLELVRELSIPAIGTLTDFFGICYTAQLQSASGGLCRGPNRLRTNCIACRLREESNYPDATSRQKIIGNHPISTMSAVAMRFACKLPRYRRSRIADLVTDIADMPDVMRNLYSSYRAVIAPTCFLRDAYINNGLTVPVHVSHFGVDTARSPKPPKDHAAPLLFAYVGQIAPHKGTDLLIDAFRSLPPGTAELWIYGKEDQIPLYTTKLKESARGLPIRFCGTFPKEEIDKVLAPVDFLVIPARWYENSPLVLLNSLASHTPVIVSDVAGMTEFVEHGRNGFVFKRGSKKDLVRILTQIVHDPPTARKMSETTDYPRTTRTMAEDVVAIYCSVINSV